MTRTHHSLGALALAVALLLGAATTALATHDFQDVPTSSVHHDGASWMKSRGISLGCNSAGTLYCPDNAVTRAQMGTFLRRASDVYVPVIFSWNDCCRGLDPDVTEFICVDTFRTSSFPRHFIQTITGSLKTTAAIGLRIEPVYSVSGGSWFSSSNPVDADATTSQDLAFSVTGDGILQPNTDYRFAARITRQSANGGTSDIPNFACTSVNQFFEG